MVKMPMLRPVLTSRNLEATQAFYENKLGFKKVFQWPQDEKPMVIEMEYDSCKLMFVRNDETPPNLTGSIELFVSDIHQYHQDVHGNEATPSEICRDHGGSDFFVIADPDKYELRFIEPIDRYKKFFGLETPAVGS